MLLRLREKQSRRFADKKFICESAATFSDRRFSVAAGLPPAISEADELPLFLSLSHIILLVNGVFPANFLMPKFFSTFVITKQQHNG